VENKGGGVPLKASRFIITSNTYPGSWWPDAPVNDRDAILRRLQISYMEPDPKYETEDEEEEEEW